MRDRFARAVRRFRFARHERRLRRERDRQLADDLARILSRSDHSPHDPMISPEKRAASRYPAIQAGRHHAEAFCLMTYRDEVNGREERLWNSRDGVTPFVITSKWGNSAQHVGRDEYHPMHVPAVGDRVFVDLTPERAREQGERYADILDEREDEYNLSAHLKERGITRERFIERFAEDALRQGMPHDPEERAKLRAKLDAEGYTAGPPDVVVVTAEMVRRFRAQAIEVGEADPIVQARREQERASADMHRVLRASLLRSQIQEATRELREIGDGVAPGDAPEERDSRLVLPDSPGAPQLISEPFQQGQRLTVGRTEFVVHRVQRRGLVLRYLRHS